MKKLFYLIFLVGIISFSSCQKTISGNGYVFDKEKGVPVVGASVSAYLDHPGSETLQMQTETDKQGAYIVASQPYACTGSCPDLVVSIVADGYQSEYVRNPHGDTTFLAKGK